MIKEILSNGLEHIETVSISPNKGQTSAKNISVTVIITRLDVLNYEVDKIAGSIGTPVLCQDKKTGRLYEEIFFLTSD